jgi:hypothetical protein
MLSNKFVFYEILELRVKYFMFFPFMGHQCIVESLVIRQISGVIETSLTHQISSFLFFPPLPHLQSIGLPESGVYMCTLTVLEHLTPTGLPFVASGFVFSFPD